MLFRQAKALIDVQSVDIARPESLEAQSVIALRMLRMAAGGARAEAEAGRMMTEKMLAAGEAQMAAATATIRGHKNHVVAGKALNVYRKRIRANRRRLSR